jgi:ABC-type multidrug transport system ATPase subunit
MKQKLALCCALIHKPEVLFLDEPTTGVDVVSRKEFWDMLKSLQQSGLTIMVSTPYMDEAALCDRIALIQKGKILSVNKPKTLTDSYGEPLYKVTGGNMYKMLNALRSFHLTSSCFAFGDALHLTLNHGTDISAALLFMRQEGFSEVKFETAEPGIEDCFIKLLKTD